MANNGITRKLSLEEMMRQKDASQLKRVLGTFELMMLGIGVIVGTGIFVITGTAAADYAGPALMLSFAFAGIVCGLAALCYAELAAAIPTAGSAFTFTYIGLGEIWAWIVAWCLILELTVAAAAISTGWGAYVVNLLQVMGVHLPQSITTDPLSGGIINLPSLIVVAAVVWLLKRGTKESAKVNNILVIIKVSAVLLFIVLGITHIDAANYNPFLPYGMSGVFSGAAIVFFAYVGFDIIANSAEEVKNPEKDLPRGIIGCLAIVTILYIVVTAVLVGVQPYDVYHGQAAPVAFALAQIGINWGSALISVSAIIGLIAGVLTCTFSASRLCFALARDGLLPKRFSHVNEKSGVPDLAINLVWLVASILTGFFPLGIIAELVNMGTLMAFVFVSLTVVVMRRSHPDMDRPFRMPGGSWLPFISALACAFLISQLAPLTWLFFGIWTIIGLAIYFGYGKTNSVMNQEHTG
ncbi:MAG: amino acid permease [Eubacteriales bacterium]|nr:amino acid permease [Eubacteriales bacterium]MDD4390247.1 amino acid permease [Eubacteriales bacterium]